MVTSGELSNSTNESGKSAEGREASGTHALLKVHLHYALAHAPAAGFQTPPT